HSGLASAANLLLRANDQLLFNRAIPLAQQPDTLLLQGQWEAESGAWLRGEATIEGAPDALPADNRVFFSLPPVVEGKVAVLAQSTYLRLALSPEVMRGQWSATFLDPSHVVGASERGSVEAAERESVGASKRGSVEASTLQRSNAPRSDAPRSDAP